MTMLPESVFIAALVSIRIPLLAETLTELRVWVPLSKVTEPAVEVIFRSVKAVVPPSTILLPMVISPGSERLMSPPSPSTERVPPPLMVPLVALFTVRVMESALFTVEEIEMPEELAVSRFIARPPTSTLAALMAMAPVMPVLMAKLSAATESVPVLAMVTSLALRISRPLVVAVISAPPIVTLAPLPVRSSRPLSPATVRVRPVPGVNVIFPLLVVMSGMLIFPFAALVDTRETSLPLVVTLISARASMVIAPAILTLKSPLAMVMSPVF